MGGGKAEVKKKAGVMREVRWIGATWGIRLRGHGASA